MALGKCLLTGANGTFVKSHLIPQALSAPVFPGAYFVSAGNRVRPTRSFTSWYDPKIVTRKGEDVLADLDSYAITVLRMHKLVWSSWGEAPCLEPSLHRIFSGAKGYRRVSFENQDKIRLFFLSLLWRWAVSTLPVAAEINLSLAQQHQLRDMILASDSGDPMLFSVELVQLSTIGERQNMSPITSVKIIEDLDSNIKKQCLFIDSTLTGWSYILVCPLKLFRRPDLF
ncbi:hypothetical protein [Pseudomonas psychrophila]|uniref:hypothetical protein n=1 Tax=Pseudomonas psychrophila TaxID=122355 RepID=UPI00036C52BF|nr:hypothetical protein [Pseudomonas psychrophila]